MTMNEFTKIVLNTDPLERKGRLFIYGIEERVSASLDFVKTQYRNYPDLERAINYVEYLHSETIKADIDSLYKLGYYPATETEMELDYAVKHALIGSYKAAFSDLRRALELSIVFVYLSSEQVERRKALDWITSRGNTPSFSKALGKLITEGRFQDIDRVCNWKSNLQDLYWELSDFNHNKGQLKGYRELNNTSFLVAGTSTPSIKYETLELFCDLYIQVVSEIVAIQALYNPIILVGLPVDEKFGLNGPVSGYLNVEQVKLVNALIPQKYRDYFESLVENDKEIQSIVEYFASLPDLTDDDLKKQAKEQREFLEQLKKKGGTINGNIAPNPVCTGRG